MDEPKIIEVPRQVAYRGILEKYIGATCIYCQHVMQSVDDVIERDIVRAGDDQVACRSCWEQNHPDKPEAPNR